MRKIFLTIFIFVAFISNAQTYKGQIGINITEFPWIDLMHNAISFSGASDFEVLSASEVDSNYWPTCDFNVVVCDHRPYPEWSGNIDDPEQHRTDMSGIYHCSFSGKADVSKVDGPFTIQAYNYDIATNMSTFEINMPAPGPNHGLIYLKFSNTQRTLANSIGSGITNLKIIRPGYLSDLYQPFTNQFYDMLTAANFSVIHSEPLPGSAQIALTYPDVLNWDKRAKKQHAIYNPILDKRDRAPWEYFISLCNKVDMDIWLSIPIAADSIYVSNLAQLVKDSLKKNLKVYIEIDDEVWGYSEPKSYNIAQASALAITPVQNYARLTALAGKIFGLVFGMDSMITKIRPVLQWTNNWALASNQDFDNMLNYVKDHFGPAEKFIYGIGMSNYFGATNENGSADDILISMKAGCERDKNYYTTGVNKAAEWKLEGGWIANEGGQGTAIGSMSNFENRINAVRDSSIGAYIRYNLEDCFFDLGAKLALPYALSYPYSRWGFWGLTDDINLPHRNMQFKAIQELTGAVETPQPPVHFSVNIDSLAKKPRLVWKDIANDETQFVIQRKPLGGQFQIIASLPADDTSYVDSTITNGIFFYRMYAQNGFGKSSYSFLAKINFDDDFSPPTKPGKPQLVEKTTNNIKISWDPSTDNKSSVTYHVYLNQLKIKDLADTSLDIPFTSFIANEGNVMYIVASDVRKNLSLPSDTMLYYHNPNSIDHKINRINYWPNPCMGTLNLLLPVNAGTEKLEIFNLRGQLVSSLALSNEPNQFQVDVSLLVPGIYFIKLYANDLVIMEKFIKQ